MTTKGKAKAGKSGDVRTDEAPRRPRSEAYDAIVGEYSSAIELIWKGSYAEARERMLALAARAPDEIALAERARTYAGVCERRMAAAPTPVTEPDACYLEGVGLANAGKLEEALALLDRAVQARSDDASYLYARAAVRGLQGNAEAAAADLRRAVRIEPHYRYQAVNDPDFQRVRDEAVFIDVIEPTHAGA